MKKIWPKRKDLDAEFLGPYSLGEYFMVSYEETLIDNIVGYYKRPTRYTPSI